jgi:hypothetical protein
VVNESVEPDGPIEAYAHGAVTAALILNVAPTARVTVYPVVGFPDEASESAIVRWLIRLSRLPDVDVVAMCLALADDGFLSSVNRNVRASVEELLPLGPRAVIVVASGNVDVGQPVVTFPGGCRAVLTVGAVDAKRVRAPYSRYIFAPDALGPELFAVAPGGRSAYGETPDHAVTVGEAGMVGTSVAAAYAAGLIARLIGQGDALQRESYKEILAKVRMTADSTCGEGQEDEYGVGLIRQCLPPG